MMPDQSRKIIVPKSIKYGVWPGGKWFCAIAEDQDGSDLGMWLHHPETSLETEWQVFRYGMFRKRGLGQCR